MADLVVPQLGESITEAVVAKWLVNVGDAVAVDQAVVDLETDKITVQLPSPVAGALVDQRFAVGATVRVGDVIGSVDPKQAGKAAAPSADAGPAGRAASVAAPMAAAGAAASGASPRTPVADSRSDASTTATSARAGGASGSAAGSTAGSAAGSVGSAASSAAGSAAGNAAGNAARSNAASGGAAGSAAAGSTGMSATNSAGAPPSPSDRGRNAPSGNGNGAAIDRDALLKLTPSQRAHAREVGAMPRAAQAKPDDSAQIAARLAAVDARDEIVPMSTLRKRVAERLVQAQTESASLTTFNEVDMTAVMDLRAKYKESFEKSHGVKLGFMSFFVKACIAAARLFPGINAEVIGGNIVYKRHYDFGIAVGTPKGLVVPVLRDCDQRSFAGIETGILELANRARDGKLALADLSGGTFSITNGGIYGSMMSTPLLNYPQTGILGMHNIVKRAMVIGDEIKVRPMMYLALSYDHRVVDGKEAVSFLVAVKDRLESPDRMLVEV